MDASKTINEVRSINIPQKSKDIVKGYTRSRFENIFRLGMGSNHRCKIISSPLIQLISSYYYIEDKFNYELSKFCYTILQNNHLALSKSEGSHAGTAYLSRIVTNGIHKWTFKIIKVATKCLFMTIGIWKEHHPRIRNIRLDDAKGSCYGWIVNVLDCGQILAGDGECNGCYGVRSCVNGDVVEMILDLNCMTLRYTLNGYDLGVAYYGIERCSYRAAVSMNKRNEAIEFLFYENFTK